MKRTEILVFVEDNCPSCENVLAVLKPIVQEDEFLTICVVHRRREPMVFAYYNVLIVPAVFMNGELLFYGEFTPENFRQALVKSYEQSGKGVEYAAT